MADSIKTPHDVLQNTGNPKQNGVSTFRLSYKGREEDVVLDRELACCFVNLKPTNEEKKKDYCTNILVHKRLQHSLDCMQESLSVTCICVAICIHYS